MIYFFEAFLITLLVWDNLLPELWGHIYWRLADWSLKSTPGVLHVFFFKLVYLEIMGVDLGLAFILLDFFFLSKISKVAVDAYS